MGCIFNCFRARDDESTSDSVSQVKSKRDHVSKNRLSALFASEEKAASSPCDDREGTSLNSMRINKDLKDEARFLKACSTTTAKPVEIRKTSTELKSSQHGEHLGSSPFLISSNSGAVYHLDDLNNEPCEEKGISLDISDQTSSSCLTDARNNARMSSASSEASEESINTVLRDYVDKTGMVPPKAGNFRRKTKPAQSECDFDQCYSSSSSINSTSREQAKVQACKEKTENKSPTSTICEGKLKDSSNETHRIGETSNSPRMKHSSKNMEAISITPWDKPIIGMVAAHWNEKELSQISPKWWDGNGIPNSTNKYKEDQKVSWHETSFEERLEKALSEEGSKGFIPSRMLESVEESEKDTAISHLRHSAESMSVVSF